MPGEWLLATSQACAWNA